MKRRKKLFSFFFYSILLIELPSGVLSNIFSHVDTQIACRDNCVYLILMLPKHYNALVLERERQNIRIVFSLSPPLFLVVIALRKTVEMQAMKVRRERETTILLKDKLSGKEKRRRRNEEQVLINIHSLYFYKKNRQTSLRNFLDLLVRSMI